MFTPWGEVISAAVAGVFLIAGAIAQALHIPGTALLLWWTSLAVGLIHGLRAAWDALREGKVDIDVLMAVAAILAAAMGAPAEGALLLFLFVLAGGLEALATARTTRAVEALSKLIPTRALKRVESVANASAGRDEFIEVPPESLVAGDIVKLLPGESAPTDAQLTQGQTSMDQATLTGESVPRSVREGDQLFAGTINVGNPVLARVTRASSESSLQKILNLVLEAQQQREPVQRLIDKVNQPYAIGVLATSLVVFLVWWLLFGDTLREALYTAITLLIVASPCAVIISTPTATLAGIARAARAGVLFKGGQAIERLSRLSAVCFDKTGTLTVGKMRVHELQPIGWSDETRLLSVAAGLEQDSTHPIAAAIRAEAVARKVVPLASTNPGFTPGRGVSAEFESLPARLGTYVFVEPLVPICFRARVQEVLASVQKHGSIATTVAWNEQAGVIILSDQVRPGADRLVQDLHAMGVRPVVMLTGDNSATASAVAQSLGLDRFHAEMLPEDKVRAVESLQRELRGTHSRAAVGVIGDGVNDAPALASADVSIAIGSIGSDAALESADIVLLSDDLGVVPWAVGLARRTRQTIAMNLTFALGAIVVMAISVLVASRFGVVVPMWMGVLGHEGGTLLVVGYSLLLLLYRAPGGRTTSAL